MGHMRPPDIDIMVAACLGIRRRRPSHEKTMTTRLALVIVIATFLSCVGSLTASACGPTVNLAAIDQRMADPNLPGDVKAQANALKARAAAEIKDDHPATGRQLYFKLMELLGVPLYSGKYRCG